MSDHQLPPEEALTLEQHRALNLARPYTETVTYDPKHGGIGGSIRSRAKRSRQAETSTVFNTPDMFDIANRNGKGQQADVASYDKARHQARRARKAAQRPAETSGADLSTDTPHEPHNTAEGHTA